ncbi:hypothetical protein HanLR1_Chr07g0256671 [Helianthus annuus]|nr:hypothetical protein HanHA89_Chr07g0274441 [Helianthus annuus]KAJ0729772.1 hypothetical protein HanLR1_Chr07g0256671 [Helianthus annuus]
MRRSDQVRHMDAQMELICKLMTRIKPEDIWIIMSGSLLLKIHRMWIIVSYLRMSQVCLDIRCLKYTVQCGSRDSIRSHTFRVHTCIGDHRMSILRNNNIKSLSRHLHSSRSSKEGV